MRILYRLKAKKSSRTQWRACLKQINWWLWVGMLTLLRFMRVPLIISILWSYTGFQHSVFNTTARALPLAYQLHYNCDIIILVHGEKMYYYNFCLVLVLLHSNHHFDWYICMNVYKQNLSLSSWEKGSFLLVQPSAIKLCGNDDKYKSY